jgi:hypothetical protein
MRLTQGQMRYVVTQARTKKEGDISSVFTSLSGGSFEPLPPRFAALKQSLTANNEKSMTENFHSLLSLLPAEIDRVSSTGPGIIPSIEFSEINNYSRVHGFSESLKKRGVAVVHNVIPPSEALALKEDIRSYLRANPQTKAFPPHDPQVYELYWSPSQVRARAHPNLLSAQKFLLSFWNTNSAPDTPIDMSCPVAYADRLRIRQPGDTGFALGPHVDGGSVERWEPQGYGLTPLYQPIFSGRWQDYDPWDASGRVGINSDLYNGAGACSMFRSFQGWLSMSSTGPAEGTLLVCPLVQMATAYFLLRPFFTPLNPDRTRSGYLDAANWVLAPQQDSTLHGAMLGCTQELSTELHPHLQLGRSMVHVPRVQPGDYVVWHCDTIHAVDKVHRGQTDSSVMYIPTCPLTELNAGFLARQRDAFLEGTPGPDFPGGKGESGHVGRVGPEEIERVGGVAGSRAMGLTGWDETDSLMAKVNSALRF